MGTGGLPNHWDGTDLRERLLEEMADVAAAIDFVLIHNFAHDPVNMARFNERAAMKLQLFRKWHTEGEPPLPGEVVRVPTAARPR